MPHLDGDLNGVAPVAAGDRDALRHHLAHRERRRLRLRLLLVGEPHHHGERVRVAPNHTCMTSAAHDRYHVVDGSDEVVAVWPRISGW